MVGGVEGGRGEGIGWKGGGGDLGEVPTMVNKMRLKDERWRMARGSDQQAVLHCTCSLLAHCEYALAVHEHRRQLSHDRVDCVAAEDDA
jgi:hypothetical protein